MYQVVNNLSHQAGAHAFRVGVDVLYNDDEVTYPRSARGAYTFSSLANFLSGAYNNAGFTQTFGASAVSQTNPNVGMYAQDEWKITPRVTLNAGLRYDLQFVDAIETDTNNISPRVGRRVGAVRGAPHDRARQRRPLLRSRAAARGRQRAAVRQQHDGSREPASDQRQPVADAGGRAGVSERARRSGAAVRHAAESDDDGSGAAECVFASGERRDRAADWRARDGERGVSLHSRPESADVDQSERAELRRVGHEQRLPSDSRLRQQQPVLVGWRLELSRAARVVHAASGGVGTLSRVVYAVEVDEQSRRGLLQLADRSVRPVEGLGTLGQRPASSARDQRHGADADDAGAQRVGAAVARLPGERDRSRPIRSFRSTLLPV